MVVIQQVLALLNLFTIALVTLLTNRKDPP